MIEKMYICVTHCITDVYAACGESESLSNDNRAEMAMADIETPVLVNRLRFLTEIDENTEVAPKKLLENEYTREALGYVERGAYTKEQLEQYEQRKIDTMTSQAIIKEAEEKAEERARKEIEGVIAQKDQDLAQKDIIIQDLLKQVAQLHPPKTPTQ